MSRRTLPYLSSAWCNVTVAVLVLLLLLALIVRGLHGQFSYTVDDAYIHLALTQRITHGLYGINAGEASSPSSSLLWPLLFVPFGRMHALLYLPLLVNFVCTALTAFLLGAMVDRALGGDRRSRWAARLLSVLLLFALNLFGLAYLGLEHSLEVLLAVMSAAGLLRLVDGERVPWWALAAAVVIPSVRYEGVLIACCVAVALWWVGRRGTAVLLLGLSVLPLVLFGLFLRHLGLPFAPMSVLAKSNSLFGGEHFSAGELLRFVKFSLLAHMGLPERFSILLLLCTLGWMAVHLRRNHAAFAVSLAGALACLGHFYVGPYGWLYRYEVYCVAFAVVLAVGLAIRFGSPMRTEVGLNAAVRFVPGGVLVGVAALALFYWNALAGVPQAAAAVLHEQGQVARFTRDFYPGPVGLHDLGWIAVGRSPEQYTMDLEGLGSYEAFRKRGHMTPEDFNTLVRKHHIGLVVASPTWFSTLPPEWKPMGKLCQVPHQESFGQISKAVVFYATPGGDPAEIEAKLAAFKPTLPPEVPLEVGPTTTEPSCK